MSADLTQAQLSKLPKFAQEYISNLQRQRDAAVHALNKFTDAQAESAFYVDENICTGEESGPSRKRTYIQTRQIVCCSEGVEVRVFASGALYGKSRPGIEIQWSTPQHGHGDICMRPESFQYIRLCRKEDMR